MLNRYHAPKLVAFGTALALTLSACNGETGNSDPNATFPAPSRIGDNPPPEDIAACTGKLDGFEPQDGFYGEVLVSAYKVTSIAEGPCASIYDLATLKGVGGLAVGDEFIGGCTFEDDKARIHVTAPNTAGVAEGDVNLTEAGIAQVNAAIMPSCASQGIPDKGSFTPE